MNQDRLLYERKLWADGFKRVMGLDEVGRGCLCGPVVAAGVILPRGIKLEGVRDSKTISELKRRELATIIREKALLWASIDTMLRCTEIKDACPDYLLVDGNRYTSSLIPHTCIVKGDDKSLSIGAASILAKVYRDDLMVKLGKEYPEFNWQKNVGYPTPEHKKALLKYGSTIHHRQSFKLGTNKKYKKA